MSLPGTESQEGTEMIPGRLWLGGLRAALDENFLQKNNITVVFNCTKDIPFSPVVPMQYRVPIDDNLEEEEINNLLKWSPEAVFKLMREYNSGKNILIHCMAGMQRSAAVCHMFLMTLWRQKKEPIYAFMREKRPIVYRPSMNFQKSVEWYETWLHTNILKT
jgi:protein-tyrosine phosphatase